MRGKEKCLAARQAHFLEGQKQRPHKNVRAGGKTNRKTFLSWRLARSREKPMSRSKINVVIDHTAGHHTGTQMLRPLEIKAIGNRDKVPDNARISGHIQMIGSASQPHSDEDGTCSGWLACLQALGSSISIQAGEVRPTVSKRSSITFQETRENFQ